MDKIFEEIFNYVKDLEIIDTHEHLPASENEIEKRYRCFKRIFSTLL